MIFHKTKSRSAVEIANEINDEWPATLLSLISDEDWLALDGRDEVDTVNDDGVSSLESLRRKRVVFCHYSVEWETDFIAWNWQSFTGGGVVMVALQ